MTKIRDNTTTEQPKPIEPIAFIMEQGDDVNTNLHQLRDSLNKAEKIERIAMLQERTGISLLRVTERNGDEFIITAKWNGGVL